MALVAYDYGSNSEEEEDNEIKEKIQMLRLSLKKHL